MATRCAPPREGEERTIKNLNKMRALFNGKRVKDIDGKERYVGDIINKTYGDVNDGIGKTLFDEIVWRGTYKPAIDSFDGFSDPDFRRIAREIEKEAKNLRNPKLSFLEKYFYVKRGVMQKWAITSWMNKTLNDISNYERTQFSHYLSAHIGLSRLIKTEILKRSQQKGDKDKKFLGTSKWLPGIKEVRDLEKLENTLLHELHNPKTPEQLAKVDRVRKEIIKVLETGGGEVLTELREYLETTPTNIGTKNNPKLVVYKDNTGKEYSHNIKQAGELTRGLLNQMGAVLIRGLKRHETVVRQAYLNDKSDRALLTGAGISVKRYIDKLNEEIKAIQKGVEKGNYFPHYLLETFINVENIMNRGEKEGYKNVSKDMNGLSALFSNMRNKLGTPMSAKFKRGVPFENYMKNPLSVLRKYSMDAIAFNKINHIRSTLMEGIQNLPRDSRVAEPLRDYIEDVFTVAEKGYTDRPDWVNKTVRVLTGFEFLSKIGFGVATATRNTLSGLYYVQSIGNRAFARYLRDWSSEENKGIRKIITELEKEQGFKFADMASPIFTEGLLPTKGVNVRDVDVRDDGTGNFTLQYRDGKAWKAFDSALTYGAGKGAIFQRVTENFLRKHMYRSSFMIKYKELVAGGLSKSDSTKRAGKYALDVVNKYAFEYAAHQKAPLTGGTTKPIGSFGQIAFQFFHFPLSFLQLQSEILRKSKDAALARQWDSPDLFIPTRFAGLYLFTHLMSGLLDLDLHRLMENDTVERIKDLKAFVDGEDVKGRGYVGPAVGDLIFLATMYDFIKLPDSAVTDLIFGYNNAYALTDDQKRQRLVSTLNVQASKLIMRDYKALQNGTGWNVAMHEFGLYPRAWTGELREKYPLKPLFPEAAKKKKKKEKTPAQIQAELKEKREQELTRLYRAMGV